ncbi:GNAT family N-acetyltransferase [Liquorilactobacillus hordei]|uniref:GNAT family N-acetyltransferase n=1 Tax=Liquorilactobacillus hordei TaxID=468911 RepID=A0A3Q8CLT6_9LACO|nr:GNAT family N-acetyltransferase [Liquorilactobacillus hordei]AUJ29650.1 GNAT family N-acetyltransferase [Liquorilactobacillus hordei]
MEVTLKNITKEKEDVLQNLFQLYQYEFSIYVPSVRVNSEGLFKLANLKDYRESEYYHAFFILADDRIAGFALVRESNDNQPSFIEQFFIMRYFSGKGIGKKAAKAIFKLFPGKWQVLQIKNNYPAQAFWRKVITEYTNNDFEERYDKNDDRSSIQEFEA